MASIANYSFSAKFCKYSTAYSAINSYLCNLYVHQYKFASKKIHVKYVGDDEFFNCTGLVKLRDGDNDITLEIDYADCITIHAASKEAVDAVYWRSLKRFLNTRKL
jgi:hypothetical protein